MRVLEAAIEIDASDQRVWDILKDFAAFPEWNPFIPKASGELGVGERIQVSIKPAGRFAMTFRPTLTKVEPRRELSWVGGLGVPGLADGNLPSSSNPRARDTPDSSSTRSSLASLSHRSRRSSSAVSKAASRL